MIMKKKVWMMTRMKLLCLILVLGFSSASANAWSQKERLSLTVNGSMIQLFEEIQSQTHFKFVFNHADVSGYSVECAVKDKSLTEILDLVFRGKPLHYEIVAEHVIVYHEAVGEKRDSLTSVEIRGVVKDQRGDPLPGVTVKIKGINLGTATDIKGEYKLQLPKRDSIILEFSFVGMRTQIVRYKNQSTINVVLEEDVTALDEVTIVNTGYQRVDTRKLTSAVTTLKAEDILVPGFNSIDQMLEGHVPGMIFMQNSGQLGAAPRLRIRGTSTVLGNQEPLWVVDGIVQQDPVNIDPNQLNDLDFVNLLGNAISGLNPEDIEQIDVLKDASATAIYGARAANGVIVITTKKGKVGPPRVNYSITGTYSSRPRYSDRNVNMMNSQERIALSREIMEKGIVYSNIRTWVGYEGVMKDYYDKKLSYDEMKKEIGRLETVNTDWFKTLMRDAFSHKHTLSISGGSTNLKYYASVGYNDSKGNLRKEYNHLYNANLNLEMNYNKVDIRFQMSGNVAEKRYTPSDIEVTKYAYNTSRAVPVRNEDGSLWYYRKSKPDAEMYDGQYMFNIINEVEHTYNTINSNQINFVTGINYKIIDPLKLGVTLSYGAANTYQETYHGEETYLAKTYYTQSETGNYSSLSKMPYGGELKEDNQRNNNWLLRGQLDFNKYMDENEIHLVTASAGIELSSSRYQGKRQTYLGYLPDRGKQVALINLTKYEKIIEMLTTNPEVWGGVRSDNLNRLLSGYISLSYSYKNLYMFNINGRADASNAFGDRSNDKLNPIWSLSARWNMKENILKNVNWIDVLSIRGSFGYQGNMLANETPELIIKQGNLSPTLGEYASTIYKYPNPNLNWEKTSSMNVTLDFSFLKSKINGTFSYYYKKTKDAFLTKTISEINGVSSYVVNRGTLENSGVEIALNFIPINTISAGNPNGFKWRFDPQLGQVLNKLIDKATEKKDKVFEDEKSITYRDYLNGSAQVAGRPLNTFYSYKFKGLDPTDGRPMFYDIDQENEATYDAMTKEDVFLTVMEHSGTRVPVLQGGLINSFSYRRFTLSLNMTYSLGSKIRLLQLYPNVNYQNGTIAPQPLENVRRELLERWQRPGDENNTTIPGIISNNEFKKTLTPWWSKEKEYKFSQNIWEMYDNSNIRVVSGNYLKLQSFSLRYNVPEEFCRKIYMKSMYLSFSGTNLFTICSKKLKGQDPATQSGNSGTINMSLRPTYSFNLNVSF